MTRTRLSTLLTGAAIALLLAGCGAPAPSEPAPEPTTDAPAEPISVGDLDYPYDLSEEFISAIDEAKGAFLDWHEGFSADCTADLAGSADSPDCTEGMLTGLQDVNAIKTQFDFAYDNADWDSGEYSGLVALSPTRDAVMAASQTGSDFIDVCYYVPGANEDCPDVAQVFLDEADELATSLAGWTA